MGFIPLSYWGSACSDLLPSQSLVFYFNANIPQSYDTFYTASNDNGNRTGIINLANPYTYLGTVAGEYSSSISAINCKNGSIVTPLVDFNSETAISGTFMIKVKPNKNGQDWYLWKGSATERGVRMYGSYGATTWGTIGFSGAPAWACPSTALGAIPTGSIVGYDNNFVTFAIAKGTGTRQTYIKLNQDNFNTTWGTGSWGNLCQFQDGIQTFGPGSGDIQAMAYWNRELTVSEMISASTAFNCNGLPQGYPSITASATTSTVRFYAGSNGSSAIFLKSGSIYPTTVPLSPGQEYYDCICNDLNDADQRVILETGGGATAQLIASGVCLVSSSTQYPTVEYLLVGGGGGGGARGGGGGGAGGYLSGSLTLTTGSVYSIVIGNGGIGSTTASIGTNGQDTTAFGLTAFGGGLGGSNSGSFQKDGYNGGCGGGAAVSSSVGGLGSQGGNGGAAVGAAAGGGGGASQNGVDGNPYGGNGGAGKAWLELSASYYAGGGGGSRSNSAGTEGGGGLGGGGRAAWANDFADPGVPNTGGGGGAGYFTGAQTYGANGGSGIVAIRYNGNPRFNQGTIETYLGMTYHYFTSSFTLNT